MENKFINLYNTFCKSLSNLAKSKTADPKTDFVLEGTVLNFSLTFDISWKVMKDILIKKMGILDFAVGSRIVNKQIKVFPCEYSPSYQIKL